VTLVWPPMLWLLALLPIAVLVYLRLPERRRPAGVRFAGIVATPAALGWRRHVPPALLLLALGVLIVATARPMVSAIVNAARSTIILAMDVSQSMAAEDIQPTRHEASQHAAKQFIALQPPTVEIGIVAFASTGFVAQPPTTDHAMLFRAVDRLELLRNTAVGSGIVTSLQTIFPDTNLATALYGGKPLSKALRLEVLTNAARNNPNAGAGAVLEASEDSPLVWAAGPGSYESAVVILMTDGKTTMGPDPRRAGQLAANLGVRVFTIGFGSDTGAVIQSGGATIPADVDEPTLRDIADKTGADYYRAYSADELAQIYSTMATRFVREKLDIDLAFLLAGIGAALAMAAGVLSLWWSGRVP
jgi:Ca-activated chloride channel family protein